MKTPDSIKEYDSVELVRDIPDHQLKAGERGTVLIVHDADNFEVEFLWPESPRTKALLTLSRHELRRV